MAATARRTGAPPDTGATPRRVWWMSVDGGREARQLSALTGLGRAGSEWPRPPAGVVGPEVVLVCQATTTGVMAAVRAVDTWLGTGQPVPVRGLVVVAGGSPVPPGVADRVDVLARWVRVWRMGWGAERVADPAEVLGTGDTAALRWFIATARATVSADASAFTRRLRLQHRSRGW